MVYTIERVFYKSGDSEDSHPRARNQTPATGEIDPDIVVISNPNTPIRAVSLASTRSKEKARAVPHAAQVGYSPKASIFKCLKRLFPPKILIKLLPMAAHLFLSVQNVENPLSAPQLLMKPASQRVIDVDFMDDANYDWNAPHRAS